MEKNKDKDAQSSFDFLKLLKVCLKSWRIFAISIAGCLALAVLYIIIHVPAYEIDAQLKLPAETMGNLKIDMAQSFSLGDMFGSSTIDNEIGVIKSHNVFLNTARDMKLNAGYFEKKWGLKWYPMATTTPINVSTIPSIPDTLRTTLVFDLKRLDNGNVNIELTVRKKTIMKVKDQSLPAILETPYGPFTITTTEYWDKSEATRLRATYCSYSRAAETYTELVEAFAPNKKADIIGLAFKTTDPTFGKELLNTIISNYNLVGSNIKDMKNTETLDFVNKRLESLRREIAVSESTMEQFKKSNQITVVEYDAAYVMEKLGRLELALIQTETENKILNETLAFVSNPNNKYSVIPNLPSSNASASVGDMAEDPGAAASIISSASKELNVYNQLVLERMRLMATSTKTGQTSIKLIDEQIDALHESIISSVTRAVETSNVKLAEARKQYSLIQNRIGSLPELEKEYINIERNMLVQQQLYLFLLKQREEASMNIAKATHSIDVIDEPYTLSEPLGLTTKMTLLLAIFIGGLAAIGWIFLFKFKNAPVLSQDEITERVQPPFVASLPKDKTPNDLVKTNPNTPSAEAIRVLRSELQFILSGIDDQSTGQVVAIESMSNGEGKTYTAINLALALAMSGKKTLLIDAALHDPHVAQNLGVNNGSGLTEALENNKQPVVSQVPAGLYSLNVITAGVDPSRHHPSELLSSGRLDILVKTLRQQYDYIIIDTPAIDNHSDALAIADIPDVTVIIVRQNLTTPDKIDKINKLYQAGRLKRMLVVANDISANKA